MTLLLEEVYKLQVLDLDILSSSKLLSDIKYKISEKKELDSLEEKLNINSSNLKKLQVMKNNVELDVASIQESVNLISKKIYGGSIKNSKELIALDGEKNFLEEKISDNEDKLLKIMMKIDSFEKLINSLNKRILEVNNKKQSDLPALIDKEKILVNKINELKSIRKEILPNIRQDILMMYEQLLKSKDGLAVVKVIRGKCEGCRISIPSADLQRVRNSSTIIRCSTCNRIIFSD